MAESAKWYVVHTYSGYENTVKATIEKTVESRSLQDQILAISIPLETVTEITESGVSKTYDRKVYPGYVLVKMVYSDETWHGQDYQPSHINHPIRSLRSYHLMRTCGRPVPRFHRNAVDDNHDMLPLHVQTA